MRRVAYATQVLGLLVGFYLICVALIGALIALDVVAVEGIGVNRLTFLLIVVTVGAVFVVVRGVFVSTSVKARDIVGVEVTAGDEPALWQRVTYLAAQVGTRSPSRIFLVPEVNAAVWENARLLGLVPGRRQMMIGLPLMMALTPEQFDAVLAHELGHYGNRDTRLGALVGRTRQGVLSALDAAAGRRRGRGPSRFHVPGADMFVVLFRAYAKLVLRFTQEASRQQEYAADRTAAAIAGKANAAAALRELPVIDTAFDFYLDRYVGLGLEANLLPMPTDVIGGFAGLLADPERRKELDGMRDKARKADADPYDSHPPMPQRIAAIEALPEDGRPLDPSGARAVAILHHPAAAMSGVAVRALATRGAGKQAVSWDELAHAAGLHRADTNAKPLRDIVERLSGRPAHLVTFVDLVASGRYPEILAALPASEAARTTNATGRIAREHAKTVIAPMVTGWVTGELVRAGRARWTHSWAKVTGELQIAPELKAAVEAATDALTAVRPDDAPLRALVLGTGVPA